MIRRALFASSTADSSCCTSCPGLSAGLIISWFFCCCLSCFFFFSSRRRHTRCLSDWSSDVCSSDLRRRNPGHRRSWSRRSVRLQADLGAHIRSLNAPASLTHPSARRSVARRPSPTCATRLDRHRLSIQPIWDPSPFQELSVRLLDRSVVIGTVSAAALFAGTACIGAQAPAAPQGTTPPPAQAAPAAGRGALPGTESGWATFQSQCFRCHTNQAGQAPTAWSIRQLTPEEIVAALNRPSHTEGRALSDIQKRRVGEFMAGRPLGSRNAGEAKSMANQCTANPAMRDPASGPAWNGWGNDLANTRFQPAAAARLTAADVSKLKLKWAFGLPKGETNNAQPTVVSGRVFMAGDNGYVYSLDAKTGCVYWSFQNGSIVRGSPMIGAVTGQGAARWAVFFGDGHANVFGVDAQTGRQLWKTRVDELVVARINGSVT